uniref:Uncharacterized protein n=1 Tax=Zea mays TaxID=4577 RepID=C0PAQ9_MAIZE|nr:unknown [Zea mays]
MNNPMLTALTIQLGKKISPSFFCRRCLFVPCAWLC